MNPLGQGRPSEAVGEVAHDRGLLQVVHRLLRLQHHIVPLGRKRQAGVGGGGVEEGSRIPLSAPSHPWHRRKSRGVDGVCLCFVLWFMFCGFFWFFVRVCVFYGNKEGGLWDPLQSEWGSSGVPLPPAAFFHTNFHKRSGLRGEGGGWHGTAFRQGRGRGWSEVAPTSCSFFSFPKDPNGRRLQIFLEFGPFPDTPAMGARPGYLVVPCATTAVPSSFGPV